MTLRGRATAALNVGEGLSMRLRERQQVFWKRRVVPTTARAGKRQASLLNRLASVKKRTGNMGVKAGQLSKKPTDAIKTTVQKRKPQACARGSLQPIS
jgi:site-specific recombinase XerC